MSLSGNRKPALGHNKRSSVPEDIPIRLAVTFASSRARVLQGEKKLQDFYIARLQDTLYCLFRDKWLLKSGISTRKNYLLQKLWVYPCLNSSFRQWLFLKLLYKLGATTPLPWVDPIFCNIILEQELVIVFPLMIQM